MGRSIVIPSLKLMLYGVVASITVCLFSLRRTDLVGRQFETASAVMFAGMWIILFATT